jgi:hypothetical protein
MFGKTVCCYSLLISGILTACLLSFNILVCIASEGFVDSMSFTSGVTLYSPINKTYNSQSLTLNLTALVGLGLDCAITYNIDNHYQGPVPWFPIFPDEMHVINKVKGNVSLPELTQGTHNLTLHVVCTLNKGEGSATMDRYPFIPECDNITKYHATWTDTIQFTIQTEQEIPEFPTTIILSISLTSALIILVTWRRNL